MHLEGITEYSPVFDDRAIYTCLATYFGSEAPLNILHNAVEIKITDKLPVDPSGRNRKGKAVEVRGETMGNEPDGKFWYNSPRLIIEWVGTARSEPFDAIDSINLVVLLERYFPRSIVADESRLKDHQAASVRSIQSEYESQINEVTAGLGKQVSTAVTTALTGKTPIRHWMKQNGKMAKFKTDILTTVSQSTEKSLQDWVDNRFSSQFQVDTHEAMRQIDMSLLQYLK